MSVERGAGPSPSDYAVRIELATEKQKRQLAEERASLLVEKLTVQQSSAALLASALAGHHELEADCDQLRHRLEEARADNIHLAQLLENEQHELAATRLALQTAVTEADTAHQRARRLETEAAEHAQNREKLEEHLRSEVKKVALLTKTLAEKDASLQELQRHFETVSSAARALEEKCRVSDAQVRSLQESLLALQAQLHAQSARTEASGVVHQETTRRLSHYLMEAEGRHALYRGLHVHLAADVIPACEQEIVLWKQAFSERVAHIEALEDAHARDLEARCKPVAHAWIMTDETWDIHERNCRELAEAKERLSGESVKRQQAEHEREALRERVDALAAHAAALAATRISPSAVVKAHLVSSSAADCESCDALADLTLQDALQAGEILTLQEKVQLLHHRVQVQAQVVEETLYQNECLSAEVLALNAENRALVADNATLHSVRQRAEELRVELAAVAAQLSAASRERDSAELRVAVLEHDVAALRKQWDASQDISRSLTSEIDVYRKCCDELQQRLASVDEDRVATAVHDQAIAQLQSRLVDCLAKTKALESQSAADRQKITELEEENLLLRTQQQLRALRNQCQAMEEENTLLKDSASRLQRDWQSGMQVVLAERNRVVSDAAEKLLAASDEIDALTRDKFALQQQVGALQQRLSAMFDSIKSS